MDLANLNRFILLGLLWLCLLWLYWGIWLICSSSFCKIFSFLLSFLLNFQRNFPLPFSWNWLFFWLFLKWCFIFGVVTHQWLVCYWLNGLKLSGMVYYNRWSLVILVNDAKYIHCLPTHLFNFVQLFHIDSIRHS